MPTLTEARRLYRHLGDIMSHSDERQCGKKIEIVIRKEEPILGSEEMERVENSGIEYKLRFSQTVKECWTRPPWSVKSISLGNVAESLQGH